MIARQRVNSCGRGETTEDHASHLAFPVSILHWYGGQYVLASLPMYLGVDSLTFTMLARGLPATCF